MPNRLISPSKSKEVSPTKGKRVRFAEIYENEHDSPAPDLEKLTPEGRIQAALKAVHQMGYKKDGNPIYSLRAAARDYEVFIYSLYLIYELTIMD